MFDFYLASPFSHPQESVRERRLRQARDAAAWLLARGFTVYAPIPYSAPIAHHHDLPGDWEFWKPQDTAGIKSCRCFLTLWIPGIEESEGVNDEANIAALRGMPFGKMNPTTTKSRYELRLPPGLEDLRAKLGPGEDASITFYKGSVEPLKGAMNDEAGIENSEA